MPRAIWADEAEDLPGCDGDRAVVQSTDPVEFLRDCHSANQRHEGTRCYFS